MSAIANPLLGVSSGLREILDRVERVAPTEASVLVCGETGTGKELVAREIHARSPRGEGAFVAVDCATLNEDLADSELFGHRRGAFSGAEAPRLGRLPSAEGGTLYLDRVDQLGPSGQSRLLRALAEKCVLPLGETLERRVDFRLVASAGDELAERLRSGEFRRDLYFRLNVVRLDLPPLRERQGDVAFLACRFLAEIGRRFGKPTAEIEPAALAALEAYAWPGNVRELRNVLECAVASARGEVLQASDLPLFVLRPQSAARALAPAPQPRSFVEQVDDFQRRLLAETLQRCGFSQRRAAEELGLTSHQLKYLCAKLGIRRPRQALPLEAALRRGSSDGS